MNEEFNDIINSLINNGKVKEMKNYRQHCNTSCYDHSYSVAYLTYKISKKLNLDYVSATRGAMLHDLFLYDWRKSKKFNFHAFKHGKIAYLNAKKEFDLNDIESDMIIKHMWPITIKPPKYKEGFVLTIADKVCASKEILNSFVVFLNDNPVVRYAYLFYVFVFKNI